VPPKGHPVLLPACQGTLQLVFQTSCSNGEDFAMIQMGGPPRKRSRTNDIVKTYQDIILGNPQPVQSLTFRVGELTEDHNNGEYRRFANSRFAERHYGEGAFDVGGNFFNQKTTYWDDARIYDAEYGPYRYKGPQLPVAGTLITRDSGVDKYWNPVVTASSLLELNSFGSTAISRCAPTNPHSQVLTAIGELYRDGLPSATGVKTIRDKDVGSEFLNYQFGIAPLVSDLKSLHKSLTKSQKILNQYLRDSGRRVRRRYSQPEDIQTSNTTSVGIQNLGTPPLNSYLYDPYAGWNGTTRVLLTTIKSKKWFSGAFVYHAELPEGLLNNMVQRTREYNHLYGLLPTPAVLWNLTPWSWAADWISNMGDVINNVSMFQTDGLVLEYGYVMETKSITREYHMYGYNLAKAGPVNVNQRFTSIVKSRRRATPFGFGLELGSFSNRQWAILAALGISKGRAVSF
jgi:hypothetical protein